MMSSKAPGTADRQDREAESRWKSALPRGLSPVLADRSHIEQILASLADNARDAMRGGGRLTIGTANVDDIRADGGTAARGCAQLQVRDTGTGITQRCPRPCLRPLLYHQGGRRGHWPGPGRRARDHGALGWTSQRGVGTWGGDDGHDALPGHRLAQLSPSRRVWSPVTGRELSLWHSDHGDEELVDGLDRVHELLQVDWLLSHRRWRADRSCGGCLVSALDVVRITTGILRRSGRP